jgi:hypothetical protein
MNAFTIKGLVHELEVGFIVTPLDYLLTEFKVEMITDCMNPVVLKRKGNRWLMKQAGCIPFTRADIKRLGEQIERHQRSGYEN